MVRVLPGNTIAIHYTGKFEDGTVFDSTENEDPYTFTQGEGDVLPAVQRAVLGMGLGETKTVQIPEEEAYGSYNPALMVQVDRMVFDQRGVKPELGMEFQVKQDDGNPLPVRVTEIGESTVTLDANHPLAGRSIIFDLILVDILSKQVPEGEC